MRGSVSALFNISLDVLGLVLVDPVYALGIIDNFEGVENTLNPK